MGVDAAEQAHESTGYSGQALFSVLCAQYPPLVAAQQFSVFPAYSKVGSAASCGRKMANQVDTSKSARPCSWGLARFGKGVYSHPQGRDFVAVSFFEGETDGFETN
jgi:hypothetical protein